MIENMIFIFKYTFIIGVILYICLPFFMNSRLYYPSKQFFSVDIFYEDIFIPVEDNIKINAWYSAPTTKDLTVLFCHGNGGNLSFYTEIIGLLQQNGYGVMAIDYRGYGKSTGRPSEKGLYKDLRAAVRYLEKTKDTPEEKIVLWGLSLGGAVVAQVASESPNFRGVVLLSTFTSIRDMASQIFHRVFLGLNSDYTGYVTHSFLKNVIPLHHEYKSDEKIGFVESPLLIAHAVPDNIVPYDMAVKLSKLNPKAKLFISEEGGHNEYSWFYPRLFEFLGAL